MDGAAGSVYLQHAEDVAGGILVQFHVWAGALLARVDDDLAPVFRDGSAGARPAGLRRMVGCNGKVCLAVVGHRRRGRRDGGVESGLGLEMRLGLEGPDIDDRTAKQVISMRKDRHGVLAVLTPTFAGRWHPKPPSRASRTPGRAGSDSGHD